MSAFVFETINAAEASNFSAAADNLSFQSAGASGAQVSVSYLTDQIAVSWNGQTVTFGAGIQGESGITFANGSILYIGGAGADAANGTNLADGLYGGAGDDALAGGLGDDLLQGNQGSDTLSAEGGDDVVYGGRDDDALALGAGSNFGQGNLGNDTVSAAGSEGRNILLGGQGDDVVFGGGGDDVLVGNLGSDSIAGGGGADDLRGEDGGDTLDGGAGGDTFDGGAGADRFVLNAGSSSVTLDGADRINGFSAEDRLDVPGAGGDASYYQIPAAGGGYYGDPFSMTFAGALDQANSWMRSHSDYVITAQIDEGVAVFVDSNADRVADLAFILVGVGVFGVSSGLFI